MLTQTAPQFPALLSTVQFLEQGCPGYRSRAIVEGVVLDVQYCKRGTLQILVSVEDDNLPRWITAVDLVSPVNVEATALAIAS